MEINEISARIVDASLRIHRELGPGLLESVYEVVLAELLKRDGFEIERQKPVPIQAFGKTFEEGFRADLIVNGLILIELKSVEQLSRAHRKQVQTYLRLCNLRLGLLINFGGELLKGNIERIVVGDVPDLRKGPTTPK
jgi:GxxExxY protein